MAAFTYSQRQVLHAAGEALIEDIQKLHNAVLHLSTLLLEKGIITEEEWQQGNTVLPHGTVLHELQKLVVHPVAERFRQAIDEAP